MLVGTFLPLDDIKKFPEIAEFDFVKKLEFSMSCSRSRYKEEKEGFSQEIIDKFGFRPLRCFPADRFAPAFFNLMVDYRSINKTFMIFVDVDKYKLVNRGKYNIALQSGMNHDEAMESALDSSADKNLSDIFIPEEKISDAVLLAITSTAIQIPRCLNIPFFTIDGKEWQPYVMTSMIDIFARFSHVIAKADSFIDSLNFELPDIPKISGNMAQAMRDRLKFAFFIFPSLYNFMCEDKNGMDMMIGLCSSIKWCVDLIGNDAGNGGDMKWFSEKLSAFEEMTKKMQVLGQTAIISGFPGRNDICPCGSGKKFKKCCSKYQ